MKRFTRRIFSVLLVLALLFTLAPITLISASAEGETGNTGEKPSEPKPDTITLYVTKVVTEAVTDPETGEIITPAVTEEVQETVTDKSVEKSGTGWSWTPAVKDADGKVTAEGYLTLNGFNGTYIESDQSLNINLKGENTITGKSFEEALPAEEGAEPKTVTTVYGIRLKTGVLTIDKTESSTEDVLTIDLGTVSNKAYGVYLDALAVFSGVSIRGGTVNISGTQVSDENLCAFGVKLGRINVNEDSNLNVTMSKTGQLKENDKINVVTGRAYALVADTSGNINIDCSDFPDATTLVSLFTVERGFSGTATLKAPSGEGKENAKIGGLDTFRPEATGTVTFVGKIEFVSSIFTGNNYLNNFEVTAPSEYLFKSSEGGDYVMFNPVTGEAVTATTISFADGEEKDLALNPSATFDIPEGKYGEAITPISLITAVKPGTGNGSYTFTLKEGSKLPSGLSLSRSGNITGKYTSEYETGEATVAVISNGKIQELKVNYGKVTVNNPVTEVKVSAVEELPEKSDVGDEITFKAVVNPDNADIKTVKWSTTNDKVLELKSTSDKDNTATFEVIGEGTAEVIATSTQGAVSSEPVEITAIDSGFYIILDEESDTNYLIQFGEKYTGHEGWIELEGDYYYINNEGALLSGWQKIDGKWYYFYHEESDIMVTGWAYVNGNWYYMSGSGAMVTGWAAISGKWYYFNNSGAMVTGWAQISGKWYYLSSSGAMVTGWAYVNGSWYYMSGSGAMVTGWAYINGSWYYMSGSGAMVTGWAQIGGKWYYFNGSGAMLTGWQQIGGKWYYFNGNGAMLTGTQRINGRIYRFNSSGAWIA